MMLSLDLMRERLIPNAPEMEQRPVELQPASRPFASYFLLATSDTHHRE
jgi:hypothetical protein